ncbi:MULTISPECIES: M56 family metallopeptidase [Caulobacter]|jgi:beta-lactamase regulating signal transducer with metallopeptidase domain|uniref:Antirepressor regulating drug resistance protein n=1 Tax=Caulobacter vibrioides OR37 TaxID=1292034 RepID=R0CYB4_CAUVI|nr:MULTISPECIES: M56 family metallopeptidase [Caulobacter]ENZ81471.1 antirepressor regulating drug resistance protein [Caulobacter vibrioides OR37]MBQ1562142.1 peptidase M56 [Caulobacter sp.]
MTELFALALIRAQIAAAAAVLLVILLRPLARGAFGPRRAYGLWIIVPAAAAAAFFPSLAETLDFGSPARPLGVWAGKLILLWLAGCAIATAILTLREHVFRRRVDQGLAGPAVVGALWPRVVLPADFAQRFDDRERAMIQLHERTHINRGDPIANLVIAAIGVLGWCNPMIALATRLIRVDQELACDATVVALRSDIRADYAKALMKAQMGAAVSPLACGWATHPLILRVSLLNKREPSLARDIAGFLTVTFLAVAAMALVWSIAPRGPQPTDLGAQMAAQMDPYSGAITWVRVER